MAKPLAQRLQIKPGQRVLILNPPSEHLEGLQPLPQDVVVDTEPSPRTRYDVVHLFVRDKAEVDARAPEATSIHRHGYANGALRTGVREAKRLRAARSPSPMTTRPPSLQDLAGPDARPRTALGRV